MPAPKNPDFEAQHPRRTSGRFAKKRAADPPAANLPTGGSEPISDLRARPTDFVTLIDRVSKARHVPQVLIEREYWMFQVARSMQPPGKYEHSVAIMYGGSMLALAGIAERVSEDADFNITFGEGHENWSNNKGAKLLKQFEGRVCSDLPEMTSSTDDDRGSGVSRPLEFQYPASLPESLYTAHPLQPVKSDMGIRVTDAEYTITINVAPLLGRAAPGAGDSAPDIAPCKIRAMHPITALVDKLDAVGWRSQHADTTQNRDLQDIAARARDHYDLFCLLDCAQLAGHLNSGDINDAYEHMQRAEDWYRHMRTNKGRKAVNLRPRIPRPSSGYHTLSCWQPGTAQYDALARAYRSVQPLVYGFAPPWPDIAARIRSTKIL
ncbi:MAG: nucleotidyl transferase AbiEii/AbiGii toxin family protein [Acidimicrobiaceae bacterium]|nr:nucleotidyl transferase AbiEii/AbiGii toxin family protein [Acidimicrobiaceae bacterium]